MMTARELALLAVHLINEYPDYYGYFGRKEFKYREFKFRNRNPLLGLNIGVDGLKTGYTRKAGYSLVASGKRDGRRIIVVISGLKAKKDRETEARKLLEWGYGRTQ